MAALKAVKDRVAKGELDFHQAMGPDGLPKGFSGDALDDAQSHSSYGSATSIEHHHVVPIATTELPSLLTPSSTRPTNHPTNMSSAGSNALSTSKPVPIILTLKFHFHCHFYSFSALPLMAISNYLN